MKLQYIVLTLRKPTIYCLGTLVVNSWLSCEEVAGLAMDVDLASR